ncbi:MAG: hypothetical protein NTW87_19085 [Planctomycetota bacterium]|nr:hypothetical protein [Planctomycetota bacterium]
MKQYSAPGATARRSLIGTVPSGAAGEWLDAQGRWAIDPKHGQQFKAEVIRTEKEPARLREVPGIGEVRQAAIPAYCGRHESS